MKAVTISIFRTMFQFWQPKKVDYQLNRTLPLNHDAIRSWQQGIKAARKLKGLDKEVIEHLETKCILRKPYQLSTAVAAALQRMGADTLLPD